MRRSIALLAVSGPLLIGTPALAQLGMSGTSSTDIWQNGTQAVPQLGVARQSPTVQPMAASGPAGSVNNQPNANYPSWYPQQPPGTPVAGGTLVTGVTVGAFYNDNVFATNTGRMGDWAVFERPEFTWFKQGQNYSVSTDGFIEGREYAKFTSENEINGSLGANFTVMPDNDTQIVGGARYIHGHLDRGASETVVPTTTGTQLLSTVFEHPVAYDEGLESIALNKRYGNWWSSIGAAGLEIQYQDPTIGSFSGITPAVPVGTLVDLGYADGAIGTVNGRLGYVVRPLTSVFVEAAGNTRDWHVSYFDSDGYRLDAGVLFEQGPGARLKGEFWGGYMGQTYNGVTMQSISSWTYGVNLAAVVADNLTAVVQGSREAKEAALGLAYTSGTLGMGPLGASAATCTADGTNPTNAAVCVSTIESLIGGRLDYQVVRNVVVGGGVTYLQDEYQGPLAFGRVDYTFSPLLSVKYFATPNVTLGFDYRYVDFTSQGGVSPTNPTPLSVSAVSYIQNIYMLSLNARW